MSIKNSLQILAGLSLLAALAGCGDTTRVSRLPAPPAGRASAVLPVVAAEAGIDLNPLEATQNDVVTIAKTMSFASRANDFALGAGEASFDQEQRMLNLFGQSGYFQAEFTPPEERPVSDELKRVEIPMWRLSGVVIGESVSALLEKGPGQTVSIRPGMVVDGEWMCVSIDSQKAVFRNMDPTVEPNTMEVRLSLPMGGVPGGSGGGTGGGTTGGGTGGRGTGGRGSSGGGPDQPGSGK